MNIVNVAGLLEEGSAKWPVVCNPDGQLRTREELWALVAAMAAWLSHQGVQATHTVALRYPANERYLITFLALARLGATATVSAPLTLTGSQLDVLAKRGVTHTLGYESTLHHPSVKVLSTPGTIDLECASVGTVPPIVDNPGVLRLSHSSGTTGTPKPVALTHALQLARLKHRHSIMPFKPGQKLLVAMGLDAEVTLTYALYAISCGAVLVFAKSSNAEDLLETLLIHQPEYVLSSPHMFGNMINACHRFDTPRPDLCPNVFLAGGRIDNWLIERSRECLGARILSDYGSSETGMLALVEAESIPPNFMFAGKLLPGVESSILDPNTLKLTKDGHPGLLAFKAPGMIKAYSNDPETTAKYFHDGWFIPGDLGHVDAIRQIWVKGRKGKVVNNRGIKIDLQQLEDAIAAIEGVEANVWLQLRTKLNQYLVCVIQTSQDADEKNGQHLMNSIKKIIPMNHQPDRLVMVKRLPRTSSGKVDMTGLAEAIKTRLTLE